MHTNDGVGRYEARQSPMTSYWAVYDHTTQTHSGYHSQADAERIAAELNADNRLVDPPREVRVRVGGRWRFGDLNGWQRRDGKWYARVRPDRAREAWFPEPDVHEPDGVFAARRR